LIQGYRPEQRRPAVEVVDAEIFQLDLDERRGDPRARIEGEGKGADQEVLGEVELGLARAFVAHPPPLSPYEGDGLRYSSILGRDTPEDHPGMPERDEIGRHSVSQPALYANLLHQPPANPPATEDVIDQTCRVPIGIIPFRPDLAEGNGALRHGPPGDQHSAILGRLGFGNRGLAAAGRQTAEHLID